MFMLDTGTKMVDVPYKGGGMALSDMMVGTTQVMFPQLPAVLGLVTSGQVRALAVTSQQRLSQLPDVPTLDESGLPGFHVSSWNELFGPRGLPDNVRNILSDALVDAISNDSELREKMKQLGVEPIGKGHAEAEAFFDEELVRWKKVIDRTGIKLEHGSPELNEIRAFSFPRQPAVRDARRRAFRRTADGLRRRGQG
jgi:tripartite-type tricarboxylate transporter receptor subunit TctC